MTAITSIPIFIVKAIPISMFAMLISLTSYAQQANLPHKLNGTLTFNGRVLTFDVSPDGGTVVYRAEQTSQSLQELFSTPITGGPLIQLDNIAATGGDVHEFKISPDSNLVVFRGDLNTRNVEELYVTPITGGEITKLSAPMPIGGNRLEFRITPDGSRVVYATEQNASNIFEIFSVPINGGSVVRLDTPPTRMGSVGFNYKISPTSNAVVYLANPSDINVIELFSVPIAGGIVTKLDQPLLNAIDVDISDVFEYQISHDGTHVVFKASQDTPGLKELYSIPIFGGATFRVSADIDNRASVLSNYRISEDSQNVVFNAVDIPNNEGGLYSVGINGGHHALAVFPIGGSAQITGFLISPDSATIVYQKETGSLSKEIFSIPIEGGIPTKLSDPSAVLPGVSGFTPGFSISADSQQLVYLVNFNAELRSVPISGGNSITLNSTNGVLSHIISPDSSRVVFKTRKQLFAASITVGQAIKLNETLMNSGNVFGFLINSSNSHVVYMADQDTDNIAELYAVELPTNFGTTNPPTESLCIPIKAQNGNIAVVCL